MCKHNTGSSRELGGVLMLEWVIDLKMVRQKDWSGNDWKSSQCPKENFKNTSREPGGVLLKNILRNYKKVYFLLPRAEEMRGGSRLSHSIVQCLFYQPVRRKLTGWWWLEASSRGSPPHSDSPPGTGLWLDWLPLEKQSHTQTCG